MLCAYLRMPSHHETAQGIESEKHVRRAIIDLLGEHLVATHATAWCNLVLNLAGAELEGVSWRDITFKKCPNFSNTVFRGATKMDNVTFCDGAAFYSARLGGITLIQSATVRGSLQFFEGTFDPAVFTSKFVHKDSLVNYSGATCLDLQITCVFDEKEQGQITFTETLVPDGGRLILDGVDADHDVAPFHGVTTWRASIRVHEDAHVKLPSRYAEQVGDGGSIWTVTQGT